jgi:hypothetical protein
MTYTIKPKDLDVYIDFLKKLGVAYILKEVGTLYTVEVQGMVSVFKSNKEYIPESPGGYPSWALEGHMNAVKFMHTLKEAK